MQVFWYPPQLSVVLHVTCIDRCTPHASPIEPPSVGLRNGFCGLLSPTFAWHGWQCLTFKLDHWG